MVARTTQQAYPSALDPDRVLAVMILTAFGGGWCALALVCESNETWFETPEPSRH